MATGVVPVQAVGRSGECIARGDSVPTVASAPVASRFVVEVEYRRTVFRGNPVWVIADRGHQGELRVTVANSSETPLDVNTAVWQHHRRQVLGTW